MSQDEGRCKKIQQQRNILEQQFWNRQQTRHGGDPQKSRKHTKAIFPMWTRITKSWKTYAAQSNLFHPGSIIYLKNACSFARAYPELCPRNKLYKVYGSTKKLFIFSNIHEAGVFQMGYICALCHYKFTTMTQPKPKKNACIVWHLQNNSWNAVRVFGFCHFFGGGVANACSVGLGVLYNNLKDP